MANVKPDFTTLIRAARGVHGPFKPSTNVESGGVAAAILSGSGKIYTGVCIDTACSMGFCAEHSAIAEMLKNRESHVVAVVAITTNEKYSLLVDVVGNLLNNLIQEIWMPYWGSVQTRHYRYANFCHFHTNRSDA